MLLSWQSVSLDFIHRRWNLDWNKVFYFAFIFVKLHRYRRTKVTWCRSYRRRSAGDNAVVLLFT